VTDDLSLEEISMEALRAAFAACLSALGDARSQLDALNVFPVPDGDTGTNMYLTFESAVQAAEAAPPELGARWQALARGALLGARGNSGVILAQLLRGVAGTVYETKKADANAFRLGLRAGADSAYKAVAHPVEGTILSVARAAAEGAEACDSDVLGEVASAAADAARAALALTTEQLPALKQAGVVDAGGAGLVVLLDAGASILTGRRRIALDLPEAMKRDENEHPHREGPAYEVMFIIETEDEVVDSLRDSLDTLGDSLVVVGGDGLYNVHVHVDDAGAAVEAAMRAGTPQRLRITYLEEADALRLLGRGARPGRGLVVVTHGPGTAALLDDIGAATVPAAPRRRPSTAELLDGARRAGTREVVLLPSDKDTIPVAEAAAAELRDQGFRCAVIPTRSIVQSLAAAAVHDPGQAFDDSVVSMTRAAGATRYGAITTAAKNAMTTAGEIRKGDAIGVLSGDVVESAADLATVAVAVLTRLLQGGGELVTLVWGVNATADIRVALQKQLRHEHPDLEVVEYEGGQPLWPLILGVE
jgi:DAK2 domain fusion protein YloV